MCEELNRVGFENFDSEDCQQKVIQKIYISDEFAQLNSQVEAELEEYYGDSVSDDDLQAYLEEKVNQIYGVELKKHKLARVNDIVETFLANNDFEGAQSYRKLTNTLEETIQIMREY